MHFDWYQATIPDDPNAIIDSILDSLAPGGQVEQSRGMHGYQTTLTVRDTGNDPVVTMLAGGNRGAYPNVTARSHKAPRFAEHVRANWPKHAVTRFDVAEDLQGEGLYDDMEQICRSVAKSRRIKGRMILPDDPADGRTYYMGAATSDIRCRLYDKTAETKNRFPEALWASLNIPENWVRLEVQVRPKKAARAISAGLAPCEAWGLSNWTKELAEKAFSLDVARIKAKEDRITDDDRAYYFMLRQYGPLLRRLREDLGGWDCVGMTIGCDLEKFNP